MSETTTLLIRNPDGNVIVLHPTSWYVNTVTNRSMSSHASTEEIVTKFEVTLGKTGWKRLIRDAADAERQ